MSALRDIEQMKSPSIVKLDLFLHIIPIYQELDIIYVCFVTNLLQIDKEYSIHILDRILKRSGSKKPQRLQGWI